MAEIIITSSVLILAIAAVRRILRGKLSMRLQYALWLLVAARLLIPVNLAGSRVSVLNALPQEVRQADSLYLGPQSEVLSPPDGAEDAHFPYDFRPVTLGPSSPDNSLTYVDRYNATHHVKYDRQIDLSALLRPVWYAGMAAMAGWFLWVNRRFRKTLRASARLLDVPDCPLPVYVAEGISSPCLTGLFRPAVYVTPHCARDADRLRHVLAHELTHWRSGDALWSLVRCLCLSIYWFNPLVWLAASLSRRDCELACDEGALKRLGEEERTAYGRTLIGLIQVSASPAYLLQTATTMADGKGGLKERLTLIAKKPRVLAVAAVLAVAIAAVAAACTFTGAVSPAGPAEGSVEAALADLPEEFRSTDSSAEGVTVFTPGNTGELLSLKEGELFRAYRSILMMLSSNLEDPMGWTASVFRMDQAAYDALTESGNMPAVRSDSYWECFARDGSSYYLIHVPLTAPEVREDLTEGAELQTALIAWLKEAVLGAEGVEAYAGMRDTVPSLWPTGEQRAELEALQRDISVFPGDPDWPEQPTPEALAQVLAQEYFSAYTRLSGENNPIRLDSVEVFDLKVLGVDDPDRPTRVLFCCSTATGENQPHPSGLGAGPEMEYMQTGPHAGKWVQSWEATIFQQDGGWHFEGLSGGDSGGGWVTPPSTGTAEEAFRRLLSGDNSVLAEGENERYWADSFPREGLVYLLMDVDGDGEAELLLQHESGPEAANATLDFRDGLVYVQRADCVDGSEFEYPLRDGTMVYEWHYGDRYGFHHFRYTPGFLEETLESFTYTPAGGFSGETDEPERWQYNDQDLLPEHDRDVTREEFERLVAEKITSQRLDASMWKELST